MSSTLAHPRRVRRRLALGAIVVGTTVALAMPAAHAHVTVHPETTIGGTEDTEIVFRVPTESESASTVKLVVTLPTSPPLLDVTPRALTGWTAKVTEGALPQPVTVGGTKITKAPLTVTWTAAAGDGVPPGEYQDFAIVVDPLPDSGDLLFPTVQTYSDGSVVKWTTVQKEGAPEPENPAPAFTVTTAGSESPAATASASPAATSVESSDNGTATTVAVIALLVAALALIIGGLAFARSRRKQEA